MFYVLPCVILFLCFSVLLALRLPRLGKRELILVLFVRLFDLCLFGFVGFLFLLVSGKGCGLRLWHSLEISLTLFQGVKSKLYNVYIGHFINSVQSTRRVMSLYMPLRQRWAVIFGVPDFQLLTVSRKIDLSPRPPIPPPTPRPPPSEIFSLTVPRRFFCHGLFWLQFVFECVCCLHLFVLDSHLATLWESNCPFGFLLVMFPLGSSYFVFVFLSL